ncbi:hypothetical protein BDZ45DRAFT_793509 [Acephala macrosclerotiorum]|nr:hypothetical protein BDZ45DRAFT_793509 [Acephala macrosclerotiorum]
MTEPNKGIQVLVLRASGITGWAIMNSALSYPTTTTFSRVVGLISHSLSLKDSRFPADPRLQLYSRLDLPQDAKAITEYLRKIENIDQITHVFFAAYVRRGWADESSEQRVKENVDFTVNTVVVVENVCPNLQFWIFPTGGKYDFEFGTKVHRKTPLKETTPRVPPPYRDHLFYYPQIDTLTKLSEGKSWKFADIRPDAIVGFVPNHNPMKIAEPLALYLSLWKSLSPNLPVLFPGTAESHTHQQSNISSDQLGRFHVYVSLHPELTAGKAFNIVDEDRGISWEMVWPGIVKYFGLLGVGPLNEGGKLGGEGWVKSQKDRWDPWTKENGLRPKVLNNTCWEFMTIVTGPYSMFDRHYDLGEARRIGFTESMDHLKGYHVAFDRMRAAKIIP